jgi:phage tail-like protein
VTAQPFVLLAARPGWREAALTGAAVLGPDGVLRLRPVPAAARPLAGRSGDLGGLVPPAGVAIAPDGTVYRLDRHDALVRRRDPAGTDLHALACVGGHGSAPRRLRDPRGLALTAAGDLLIADAGNRRVQVVSARGAALRHVVGPLAVETAAGRLRVRTVGPQGGDDEAVWEPWDVAAGPDDRWYVADRAHGLIHVFGRDAAWLAAYDGRAGGGPGLRRPIRLAVDLDGRIYAVQEGRSDVVVLGAGGTYERSAVDTAGVPGQFPPIGHPRPAGPPYQRRGALVTLALDSEVYRCRWDRVELRAGVPEGAAVRVETLTADTDRPPAEIQALEDRWLPAGEDRGRDGDEWSCLVRSAPGRFLWVRLTLSGDGEVTPAVESVRVLYPRSSSIRYLPGVYRQDPAAADFLDRFLSIFDTLRTSVTATFEDLPAVLDPGASPAGGGGPDFLSWLASWIGVALDAGWPEATRRRLVERAHELYARRGTAAGLRLHVLLCTGAEPQILEHFRLRRWLTLGLGRLGDCSAIWGPEVLGRLQLDAYDAAGEVALVDSGDPALDPFAESAHRFTVFVHRHHAPGARELAALERVVEQAKPAHTDATIQVVEPRFLVGVQGFVGVDTVIGGYPEGVVAGRGRLGRDTVLGPGAAAPPTLRIGSRTRLGYGAAID